MTFIITIKLNFNIKITKIRICTTKHIKNNTSKISLTKDINKIYQIMSHKMSYNFKIIVMNKISNIVLKCHHTITSKVFD